MKLKDVWDLYGLPKELGRPTVGDEIVMLTTDSELLNSIQKIRDPKGKAGKILLYYTEGDREVCALVKRKQKAEGEEDALEH